MPLGPSEEMSEGRVEIFPAFLKACRGTRHSILVQANSDKMLFGASAIKTFLLCEALRQADSHDVVEKLEAKELVPDSTVRSLGKETFNSPDLSGSVSERTTLEAMITRSDNTAPI
jgi:beta-lactamase class A